MFVCIVRRSLRIKKERVVRRPHPSVRLCLSVRPWCTIRDKTLRRISLNSAQGYS